MTGPPGKGGQPNETRRCLLSGSKTTEGRRWKWKKWKRGTDLKKQDEKSFFKKKVRAKKRRMLLEEGEEGH